jgi:RNA polymerase sigma-B factor
MESKLKNDTPATAQYTTIESVYGDYHSNPTEASLTSLIQACQGLVFHYAKLYGGGYSFEDLCQSGYEGLLKGIQNYDPDYGTKFVTYASHCVIGEIRHYVRRESRYYYPGYLEGYREKMNEIILDSLDDRDEPISSEELAVKLNLQPDAILPVMSAGLVHLGHVELASIKAKEMESFTLPIEDKLLLSQLKYRLTDIQKDVIEMLFQRGMTQEEVAGELGLTQKQVSRIKQKSLEKMKTEKL